MKCSSKTQSGKQCRNLVSGKNKKCHLHKQKGGSPSPKKQKRDSKESLGTLYKLPNEVIFKVLKKTDPETRRNIRSVSTFMHDLDLDQASHEYTKLKQKYPTLNNVDLFIKAASKNKKGVVHYILSKYKREIHDCDICGDAAAEEAAEAGHKDMVIFILTNRNLFGGGVYPGFAYNGAERGGHHELAKYIERNFGRN